MKRNETKTKAQIHKAYQCLCFRYIDSMIPLLPKSEISILQPSAWFVPDLVGNPEDRFFHVAPHILHKRCNEGSFSGQIFSRL